MTLTKADEMKNLGRLLQLTNSAMPVGGFSYSEGMEQLIAEKVICDYDGLKGWIEDSLDYGVIRIEACALKRVYEAKSNCNEKSQIFWDQWLLSTIETEELRRQSIDMGRALQRILNALPNNVCNPGQKQSPLKNYACIYGRTAADWEISLDSAIYGYLHRWVLSIIDVGVKLIPLGQSVGQKCLWNIQTILDAKVAEIMFLVDEDLYSWNSGIVLASMNHEIQYSRLYRS